MNILIAKIIVKLIAPKLKVGVEDSFSYDTEEERVLLGIVPEDDCGFLRHMREYHEHGELADEFSLTLWSILHEIGHYHTIDYAEEDLATRALCAAIPKEVAEKNPSIQDLYFNMDDEFLATDWAVDFAYNHFRLCKIFDRLVG